MVNESRDTKILILDAAERLFADHGFAATSMRTITSEAGVNLAAVNYHFGSKEALIGEVFARRFQPVNDERLELLDRYQQEAGKGGPTLEQILEAFVGPPLRMYLDADRGGPVAMRLFGQAIGDPGGRTKMILAEQFSTIVHRFTAALKIAVPELDDTEIFWRFVFMVGAMAHTMTMGDDLPQMSCGLCDPSDVEGTIQRLVPFLAGGLRATVSARATEKA